VESSLASLPCSSVPSFSIASPSYSFHHKGRSLPCGRIDPNTCSSSLDRRFGSCGSLWKDPKLSSCDAHPRSSSGSCQFLSVRLRLSVTGVGRSDLLVAELWSSSDVLERPRPNWTGRLPQHARMLHSFRQVDSTRRYDWYLSRRWSSTSWKDFELVFRGSEDQVSSRRTLSFRISLTFLPSSAIKKKSATHFYIGGNVIGNSEIFLQARDIPGQHFAVHTVSSSLVAKPRFGSES